MNHTPKCPPTSNCGPHKIALTSLWPRSQALLFGSVSTNDRVLAMHVHLAGTALPLVWRGAKLSIFLHGIEVWKSMRMRERMALRAAIHSACKLRSTRCSGFSRSTAEFRDLPIDLCPLGIAPLEGPVLGPRLRSGRFALIVGRMVSESRYKGHDQLLELWPEVLDKFPDFSLVVAGDGPDRHVFRRKPQPWGCRKPCISPDRSTTRSCNNCIATASFLLCPVWQKDSAWFIWKRCAPAKPVLAAPGAAAAIIEARENRDHCGSQAQR